MLDQAKKGLENLKIERETVLARELEQVHSKHKTIIQSVQTLEEEIKRIRAKHEEREAENQTAVEEVSLRAQED